MKNRNPLDELWQQLRSDNEFYFMMMGSLHQEMKTYHADMAERLTAMAQVNRRFEANADERMRQIEARHRLQEQRFNAVLGATATREELRDLERRVSRLEERAS